MKPITKCDLEEIEENLRSKGVWQEGWEICSEANPGSIGTGGNLPKGGPSLVKIYESEEKKGERRKVIAHTTWSDVKPCVEELSTIISSCLPGLKFPLDKREGFKKKLGDLHYSRCAVHPGSFELLVNPM